MISGSDLPMKINDVARAFGKSRNKVLRLIKVGILEASMPDGKKRGAMVVGGDLDAINREFNRNYRCKRTLDMFADASRKEINEEYERDDA